MKNYLIVGGSTGIGKSIAHQLAAEGNRVYATYCKNQLTDLDSISYHYLDVTAHEYDLNFLPESIDGIAYCVGNISLKPFHRIALEDFQKDYHLQVLGAVKILQQLLPNLKNASQPSVTLFSTVAVQTGFTFHTMVAASKGAVEGLTKALAAEWAPKIRVNCIAPSITNTPLAAGLLSSPEKLEANAQRHPLKKIGQPEDLATLACFLLSEKAGWITGQVMHADGGMSTIR